MNKLSLIIPVFNEAGNILPLVKSIAEHRASPLFCPEELVLVNNGSTDETEKELEKAASLGNWIHVITLEKNQGYGGGIQRGFGQVSHKITHLGWIPADLQYSIESVLNIWRGVIALPHAFHHGWRTVRHDGVQTRFISKTYTLLCRLILGLNVKDINGLPKIFPRSLIEKNPPSLSSSFLLDSQILLLAKKRKLAIHSHPVTFFARRSGQSSWSSHKIRMYRKILCELFQLRLQARFW